MSTLFSSVLLGRTLWVCLVVAAFFGTRDLKAAEPRFRVQLIWGTDTEKPRNQPNLKPVDARLLEKLKAIFKWKNYFEVNRKPLSLPQGGSQKLTLSDKCDIEVQDTGYPRIEIRLYGEGKLVTTHKQTITPGEPIVIAGHDKNDTAWFVVLTPPK